MTLPNLYLISDKTAALLLTMLIAFVKEIKKSVAFPGKRAVILYHLHPQNVDNVIEVAWLFRSSIQLIKNLLHNLESGVMFVC